MRRVHHLSSSLLVLAVTLALAGCLQNGPPDGWHGPPDDELNTIGLPTTCDPHLEYYPIGGPHNGGWDSNATTFTCPSHPGGSPDNSDWIGGDHYGNDLFAVEGTPAIAVVSGTISHSGYSGISGNRVTLLDSCGWHYFSAHLETIAPGMTVGAWVDAGEMIGTVGDTGNAAGTQAHIHFSIYPESYNSGIDPFPLLQGVDSSSCTGEASLAEGELPDPDFNPCTDADIQVDDADSGFAVVSGATETGGEVGGGDDFEYVLPYAFDVPYTVVRWGPYVPHPGKWEVDVHIPDAPFDLTTSAVYDVAFHGGHALATIDQSAQPGDWVELFPGQPLKFLAGTRGYTGLSNLGSVGAEGMVAFDAVRWRYIEPSGSGIAGSGCTLSIDCTGSLICGEAGTCIADCLDAGCDAGSCDLATGVCVEATGDEGDPLDDDSQFLDTDGDGIPNYLEGPEDADGDGVPNWWDHDSDGDGIDDEVEGAGDADGDGVLDSMDLDSDGDGMLDSEEVGPWPDDPVDSDLDGIPDFQDTDSDNDGIPDAVEGDADNDNDGLPDYADTDSDNDGIDDAVEAGFVGEDPRDSDGDGTPDYLDTDSDDDGLLDSWEGDDDIDGDGILDFRDLDSDGDGILDVDDPDADGDGVIDDPAFLDDGEIDDGFTQVCGCEAPGRTPAAGLLALLLPLALIRRRRALRHPPLREDG